MSTCRLAVLVSLLDRYLNAFCPFLGTLRSLLFYNQKSLASLIYYGRLGYRVAFYFESIIIRRNCYHLREYCIMAIILLFSPIALLRTIVLSIICNYFNLFLDKRQLYIILWLSRE